jgi:hypothetical protein
VFRNGRIVANLERHEVTEERSSSRRSAMPTELAAAMPRESARKPAQGATARARLIRAWLPTLSLALVLVAIAWLNPRAISYFGFSLMLNLAIPIVLATIAQLFVISGNELDLSIGSFVGFVGCVTATWLNDAPWLGVATLARRGLRLRGARRVDLSAQPPLDRRHARDELRLAGPGDPDAADARAARRPRGCRRSPPSASRSCRCRSSRARRSARSSTSA